MIEKRKAVLEFLRDITLLAAYSIFLISFIQPFLAFGFVSPSSDPFGMPRIIRSLWYVECWSYHGVYVEMNSLNLAKSFTDYWLNNCRSFPMISLIPDVLIVLFLVQISTLTLGLVSFYPGKRRAAIFPFLLSMVTTLLMIQADNTLATYHPQNFVSLGGGYWFTYPSTFMFLISITLSFHLHSNSRPKKESIKNMIRYWKKHRLDAVFITISMIAAAYAISQVTATLLDPMFHSLILEGRTPLGATVVPYNNPSLRWRNDFDMLRVISTEPISLSNWLGLFSPILIILPTLSMVHIRHVLWKKNTESTAGQ
jgi:hypothetical protein